MHTKVGDTPLHLAAQDVANGQSVAAELIKAGGSVSATNSLGWTPLHCAMYTNNLDVARLLIRAVSPHMLSTRPPAPPPPV